MTASIFLAITAALALVSSVMNLYQFGRNRQMHRENEAMLDQMFSFEERQRERWIGIYLEEKSE